MAKKFLSFTVISFLGLLCLWSTGYASSPHTPSSVESSITPSFAIKNVANGFSVPWGMVFINPQELLVTERHGELSRLVINTGKKRLISGLPAILAEGQGGLLDIALSPDFGRTSLVYFTYSKAVRGNGETALARARLKADSLEGWQDLFVSNTQSSTSRHYGSRIAFDNQGYVYFTIGDRGNREDAQDLNNHAGSVIRLKLDGTIPGDNPFVGQASIKPEIWSYGHRNPQGLAFSTDKQTLWLIEHGPRGGDEINLVRKGLNYGWPVITYGKEYWGPFSIGEGTEKSGMEQPVKYYVPSIAPSSLMVYSGKAFPQWKGHLFAGALRMTHLNRVEVNKQGEAVTEERLLEDLGERIRNVVEGPQGWIYVSTDSGKILELSPR